MATRRELPTHCARTSLYSFLSTSAPFVRTRRNWWKQKSATTEMISLRCEVSVGSPIACLDGAVSVASPLVMCLYGGAWLVRA